MLELWRSAASDARRDSKTFVKLASQRMWKECEAHVFEVDEKGAIFVGLMGQFVDGYCHGVGREFTVNDQCFEGHFVRGHRQGLQTIGIVLPFNSVSCDL